MSWRSNQRKKLIWKISIQFKVKKLLHKNSDQRSDEILMKRRTLIQMNSTPPRRSKHLVFHCLSKIHLLRYQILLLDSNLEEWFKCVVRLQKKTSLINLKLFLMRQLTVNSMIYWLKLMRVLINCQKVLLNKDNTLNLKWEASWLIQILNYQILSQFTTSLSELRFHVKWNLKFQSYR